MHPHSTTFGILLKRFRGAAGLTQEELAERADLSAKEISNLERGVRQVPRPHTVYLLVKALRLSARDRLLLEQTARGAPSSPVDSQLTATVQGIVSPHLSMVAGAALTDDDLLAALADLTVWHAWLMDLMLTRSANDSQRMASSARGVR